MTAELEDATATAIVRKGRTTWRIVEHKTPRQ